ncbi:hypothetical protein KIL84_003158 [Mauremys mutica]|uniref:Uncharacterized protein n=1 Tax=Mauremys mutica TaxID=74926 RepID=A0A9D3WV69_9SAUR|nr:hypothetical protein KIL84_003158 [Mauremys mutica]
MKYILSFLLAFVLSTTLCDAQCYAEMIDPKAKVPRLVDVNESTLAQIQSN